MGEKLLLIIGIDPGTTLAYAAVDCEGNVIKIHSEKNLDSNSVISELIKLGKPLIVAGDKKHNPDFVYRIAVKLGARVVSPNYDLKVSEKREISEDFKTKNQHEIDALASALFALKKMSPLLKKIDIFVEHYKKESIRQKLIEFVVGKELNIKDAAEIIEEPKKEEIKIVKEVIEEKKLNEKDFLNLYNKLKSSKKDNNLLRIQNKKLSEEIMALKKDYEYMFKQMNRSQMDKKMRSVLGFKEKRIKYFDSELNRKKEQINKMQNEVTTLLYFLSNLNSNVLLKKLDNLGINEFEKKKSILNLKKDDVLLVQDPDIVSEKTIKIIQGKINIIVYKKPVSEKIEKKLPFIFLDSSKLSIEEDDYFAIVDIQEFNKEKNKKALLSKIVNDYRKERLAQSE